MALALSLNSHAPREYDESQLTWDQQWLNAWILLFCGVLVVLWRVDGPLWLKRWLLLVGLSVFAFVAASLILSGTPFSWNSYWGDQKFRQAMILKFMVFAWPVDFYYKELPSFYPPFYYYLLSLYGKIFSVEYFKLLKIGSLLLYLLSPLMLYLLWARIVSRWQAVFIAVATLVFCGTYFSMPLPLPHEYLAHAVFVPWWLGWIQGLSRQRPGWWFYLSGGLIGGLAFMTYYYAFFVGALVLAANLSSRWFGSSREESMRGFRPAKAIAVLGLAALFSTPYWLPLAISMFTFGSHPAQREWFHASYAAIHFRFLELSWPGILFLAGLVYSFRRRRTLIHRALLHLIAASVGLYVIGYILGNIGQPILYMKANEFLYVVGGAVIGLMVTALLRYERKGGITRGTVGLLAVVLLVIFFHDFSQTVRSREIVTARKAELMDWGVELHDAEITKGSVFLTAHEVLPSFLPIFVFNAINQHYAHPASRYLDRHRFLYLLQGITDPYLFYLALRYNTYDQVDYFMPREADGRFELWSNLSRYPDRFVANTMSFSKDVVSDPAFVSPEKGVHLYRLVDRADPPPNNQAVSDDRPVAAQLFDKYRMLLLEKHLTEEGLTEWHRYLGEDSLILIRLEGSSVGNVFGDEISMPYQPVLVETADSLHLLTCFEAARTVSERYRIFLHVYDSNPIEGFSNFDFVPKQHTSTWGQGDLVFCNRAFPKNEEYESFHLGFFNDKGRVGSGWKCKIP